MPANEYYDSSGAPGTSAAGASQVMRAEFDAIEVGFNKLPTLAGNGNKAVVVNAGGTAMTVTAAALALAVAFTTAGAGAMTLRTTGATDVTLPTTGTLVAATGALTAKSFSYIDASSNIASTAAPTNGQLLIGSTGAVPVIGSIAGTAAQITSTAGAGTITLSLPAAVTLPGTLTLGGTVSGGGNQINNVIIGAVTPLAGSFTTLSASGTTTAAAINASGDVTLSTTKSFTWTGGVNYLTCTTASGAVDLVAATTLRLGAAGFVATFTSGATSLTGTLSVTGNLSVTGSGSTVAITRAAGVAQHFQISDGTRTVRLAIAADDTNYVGTTSAHDFKILSGGSVAATFNNSTQSVTAGVAGTSAHTFSGIDRVLTLASGSVGANSLLRLKDSAANKYSVGYNGGNFIIYDDVNTAYILQASQNSLTFSGAGPHSFGGATSTTAQLLLQGGFTSAAANGYNFSIQSSISPPVNQSAYAFDVQPTLVRFGSGTMPEYASARFSAPAVGGGATTITNMTTVQIEGAPGNGSMNRALWVKAGRTVLGGAPGSDYTSAALTVQTASNENLFITSDAGGVRLLSGSDGLGAYKDMDIEASAVYINTANSNPITLGGTVTCNSTVTATAHIVSGTPATAGGFRGVYGVGAGGPTVTCRNSANSANMTLISSDTRNSVVDCVMVGLTSTNGVVLKARSGAGAPTTSDIGVSEWCLWRDTSGATTKLYYNNAGALQSVALA